MNGHSATFHDREIDLSGAKKMMPVFWRETKQVLTNKSRYLTNSEIKGNNN